MTSLQDVERQALRTLDGYLASGYTIDLGGLIGIVAAQYTPSDPETLARFAILDPSLLTREPDLRSAGDDGLTPYTLLRANTYERIAARLRSECAQRQWDESTAA